MIKNAMCDITMIKKCDVLMAKGKSVIFSKTAPKNRVFFCDHNLCVRCPLEEIPMCETKSHFSNVSRFSLFFLSFPCLLGDMSGTWRDVGGLRQKLQSPRHDKGKKRPRHTQFISITANIFKSVQTYQYRSYSTFFVFELNKQSPYCKH